MLARIRAHAHTRGGDPHAPAKFFYYLLYRLTKFYKTGFFLTMTRIYYIIVYTGSILGIELMKGVVLCHYVNVDVGEKLGRWYQ